MTRYAIIVAGGSGTRFGGEVPKQFQLLCGRPVLMHTIDKFAAAGAVVTLVLPHAHHELWSELCERHGYSTPHTVATGGASRFESVRNGLSTLSLHDGDTVAVHDGVRPLVSVDLIENTYETASRTGSAIPAITPSDSIRMIDPDGNSHQLLRSDLRAVQTPQTFDAALLQGAYDVEFSPLFTDDASVVEASGHKVTLVDGQPSNIKITHPVDLIVAERLMNDERP